METIGRDLAEMQRVPLARSHVAAMRDQGSVAHYPAGTFLAQPGDPIDCFTYIEDGEVLVVNPFTGGPLNEFTLGPTQFTAEIPFIYGGNATLPLRVIRDVRVIEVPRRSMLRLMSEIPEMSDTIITVLAARRRLQLESCNGSLVLIGEEVDRNIRRLADFASRNRLPYSSYPLDSNEAKQIAADAGVPAALPVVIFGRDTIVADPTPERVARLLGISLDLAGDGVFDVLIVGGGPAGVAAGVYAGAEGLSALVAEDNAIGGQAGTSSRIENYMGFPTGISGADLVWRGEMQAMKFGTRFAVPCRVAKLERQDDGCFCATFDNGQRARAGAVVIATGVQYRRLPIDRLADFEGAGIFYAATENEAHYCGSAEAIVIGGGNSAGQAAMFLRRTVAHVRLLVRGASLAASMSSYLLSRLMADPAITIEHEAEVIGVEGAEKLDAVVIRNRADGGTRRQACCALFVMVGAAPNTDWISDLVDLDQNGFVLTGKTAGADSEYGTSQPGIFAVGDVRAGSVKRVASSVGEGSIVISQVWEYVKRS